MTGIIIQARMSSTRLPGKVMLPLAGIELLWHVVERCKQSKHAQRVIVATSNNNEDEVIETYCRSKGLEVFRGDLFDVLKRFYDCASQFGLDNIIRITSDCPLIDPFIIDESIRLFEQSNIDYVSNVLNRTFPRGLDCEVFSYTILQKAHVSATDQFEREHVTPWIVKHGHTLPYLVPKDYTGDFRLTIDEESDYQLLQEIYNRFYRAGTIIDAKTVIQFLHTHPEFVRINQQVMQKHSIN